MKIKKIIAGVLLLFFSTTFSGSVLAQENMTLYEFLKTTDEINAYYEYPSMKISANSTSGKALLPAHTPVVIRCTETITTKNVVSGGEVNFAVVTDIRDTKGNILVKAGTPVSAQISFTKTKGMVGRSGEITVTDFHTTAVDGTYIPLSGSVSAKPDDKMTTSIVLSVLVCPLFLLMKGNEAQLNAGATKTSYTVSDTYIKAVRL